VPKLPPGLYDLPITNEIERELKRLDAGSAADAREFDPADANVAFARHLAAVVRQALAGVRDDEKIARQAEIVNELLASLEQRASGVDAEDRLSLASGWTDSEF
jgi:hypothetical protein